MKTNSVQHPNTGFDTYSDSFVQLNLLFIGVVSVEWIQADVVVDQFSADLSIRQRLLSHSSRHGLPFA